MKSDADGTTFPCIARRQVGTREYDPHPAFRPGSGVRQSTWDLKTWKAPICFPPVRLEFIAGGGTLSIHHGFLAGRMAGTRWAAGSCRGGSGPRAFPAHRGRGLPIPSCGAVTGLCRAAGAVGRFRQAPQLRELALGDAGGLALPRRRAGIHRGQLNGWAGRAYEGFFTRSRPTGFSGFRRRSTALSTSPETAARRDKRRFQIAYPPVAGFYFAVWAALAIGWHRREQRLCRQVPADEGDHPKCL